MPNHELLYVVEPKLWSGTLKFEIRSNVNLLSCLRNDFMLEILKASKFRNPLFFFSLTLSRLLIRKRRNKMDF